MADKYQRELDKGRIPLWLDPEECRFLACEYSRLPEDSPEEVLRIWMRIATRAHAALQTSGHEPVPFEADRPAAPRSSR
ncbi:MAG: hypothetical protein R3174_01540 [Gammaproteobacteria bacterium]|nr:hypothetical protein [Gammaproteobacteria bacterium]